MSVAATHTPAVEGIFEQRVRPVRNGRLRAEDLPRGDRTLSIWMHLSTVLGVIIFWPIAVIAPLVLWMARRDESPFVDDHGREVLNFIISFVILHVGLVITIIGIPLIPVLWVVGLISVIRGTIAAGCNEFFRYPMTIRFIT